jgi:catechol 2,3-dioxygenase-like lactoylglutathione lyase family enzyme
VTIADTGPSSPLGAVHHLGISVADMDRSLRFWERFLGVEARSRRVVDAAFLGELVGYPGIVLEIAWLDLPDGGSLELVRHADRPEGALPHGTAHPGAAHFCFAVTDLDAATQAAIDAGATVASTSRVTIPSGANQGARHVYVRDPDGVSIELRQPPPAA